MKKYYYFIGILMLTIFSANTNAADLTWNVTIINKSNAPIKVQKTLEYFFATDFSQVTLAPNESKKFTAIQCIHPYGTSECFLYLDLTSNDGNYQGVGLHDEIVPNRDRISEIYTGVDYEHPLASQSHSYPNYYPAPATVVIEYKDNSETTASINF